MQRKRLGRLFQPHNGLSQIPPGVIQIDVDAVKEASLLDSHDLNLVEDIVDVEGVCYYLVDFLASLLEHRFLSLIQYQLTLKI